MVDVDDRKVRLPSQRKPLARDGCPQSRTKRALYGRREWRCRIRIFRGSRQKTVNPRGTGCRVDNDAPLAQEAKIVFPESELGADGIPVGIDVARYQEVESLPQDEYR